MAGDRKEDVKKADRKWEKTENCINKEAFTYF